MPARIAHTTAASVVFTPNFARICASSLFKVRGLIPSRAAAAPTSPQSAIACRHSTSRRVSPPSTTSVASAPSAGDTPPAGVWTEYGFLPPTVVRVTQGGNRTTLRLTTRLWYNGQYQLIRRQDPAGLIWEWNYDSDGKLLWSKEPNGAQTTYTYYAGTDRVWKITDALNHTWEYSYTANYHDVKSVKDPEGAVTTYEYDYELNEPAYGKVRKVIDPMGRATQYEYYPASDANLARRGQLKRVVVPGGFWRSLTMAARGG